MPARRASGRVGAGPKVRVRRKLRPPKPAPRRAPAPPAKKVVRPVGGGRQPAGAKTRKVTKAERQDRKAGRQQEIARRKRIRRAKRYELARAQSGFKPGGRQPAGSRTRLYTRPERLQIRRELHEQRYGIREKPVGPKRKGKSFFGKALDFVTRAQQEKMSPVTGFGDLAEVKLVGAGGKLLRDYAQRSTKANYEQLGGGETGRLIGETVLHPRKTLVRLAERQEKVRTGGASGMPEGAVAARAVYETGRAFVERPGKTLGSTAKSVPPLLAGVVPGAVGAVADPGKALKALQKDYERRYGPLSKGQAKEFRRRVQREGLLPEALDVATVGAIGGRAAGIAAKSGGLGRRAARVATEPRPKLRTAPGRVRPQRKSGNLAVAVAQRRLDRARAERQLKRVQRVKEDERAFVRPEEAAGIRQGEVVPLTRTGARLARTRRFQEEQGRSRTRMRRRQGEEVGASRKATAQLNRPQQHAFAYGQMGLVSLDDPAKFVSHLERRERQIKAERDRQGTKIVGRRRRKHNDELRTIAYLKANVEQIVTPKFREVVKGEQARERRVAGTDPALATSQAERARVQPQAEFLGVKPRVRVEQEGRMAPAETAGEFASRVRQAAEREGLSEPAYFRHQFEPFEQRRSDYALGTGSHGPSRGPRKRTGETFRTGQIDVRPEVFQQGLAKNIKRSEQWNFVIRNAEDNALPEVRSVSDPNHVYDTSKGVTLREAKEIVDDSALDPSEVAFVHSGKLRREAEKLESPDFEDDIAGITAQRFKESAKDYDEAKSAIASSDDVVDDAGWRIIPADIKKQQESVASQGAAGRIVRKYVKGLPSKLLLGTNPSWAILQVVNNQILAHLGGVGNVDLAKSARFFRKYPEARAEVDDFLGATTFEAERTGTRIGASAPSLKLIEEWRALKATPMLQRVGRNNPLDWLFRLDHHNNAIHRRAVAFDFLRGEAYRRMGNDVLGFGAAMKRLEHSFDLGPEQQILELAKNPEVLEEAARHTDDLLGNFTRYSVAERKLLEQNVMFYGFLRFSLRFTLYTMPVKHPVVSNLLANLSRLHEREVRRLLGLKPGDPLPGGVLASFYYIKGGKLQQIPLQRLNPAMNVLTQGDTRLSNALLTQSPLVVAAFNQAFHKDLFTGDPHLVHGESTPRETKQNPKRYPAIDIPGFAGELSRLIAPLRTAEDIRLAGQKRSYGSNVLFPKQVHYKSEPPPDVAERLRKEALRSLPTKVLQAQLPVPRESFIKGFARRYAYEQKTGKPMPRGSSAPKTPAEKLKAATNTGVKTPREKFLAAGTRRKKTPAEKFQALR
jgi:hypothetical protein